MNGTLGDFLHDCAARHGDRPALLCRPRYRTERWTYRRLWRESGRVAAWLRARGVGAGDRVVLWAPNSPWWVAAYFGALRIGAVVVPLDIRSEASFASRVAAQTGPRLALVAPPVAAAGLGDVPVVAVDRLVTELGDDAGEDIGAGVEPDWVAEIMFTSGTTGDPKGVVLTHRNILASVEGVARVLPAGRDYRLLSLLPLSHMFEQTVGLLLPLRCGARIYYPASRQPAAIFRDLARERATTILAVPQALDLFLRAIEREVDKGGRRAQWEALLRVAALLPLPLRRLLFAPAHRRLGGRLRLLVSGGAALDPAVARRWELLGVRALQGYGATEAAPCIATEGAGARRPGTVGRAVPGVELRIAPDGEVLARGANIFKGYWRNEEATAAAFADGWYRTGDRGALDADGYLTLRGRKKNLIVLDDGQNVYPEDVEDALRREPGVRDAMVYGDRTARGVRVRAVLLLEEGADPDAVVRAANGRLDARQQIRDAVRWPGEDFPRTHTLKIKRDLVIAALASGEGDDATLTRGEAPGGDDGGASPLVRLVARAADKPAAEIGGADTLGGEIGLDSLGRVELLSLVESELGVYLDESLVGPETTVAELEALLAARAGADRPTFPSWPLSAPARVARGLLWRPLVAALDLVAPGTVLGSQNLDGVRGPVLFVANHTSHLDTPAILRALPARLSARVAVAAAADYFFRNPALGAAVAPALNAFPFSRAGAVGPTLEHCAALLDRRWSLLIYPEGTRSTGGEMGPFREGVGLLAVELGVPVVPLHVDGLYGVLPKGRALPRRGRVTVRIGRPLTVEPGTSYADAAARVERAVRLLGTGDVRGDATHRACEEE